jgi:hypothetical protein
MNAPHDPQVAVDQARERYPKGNGQFEALTLETPFPEAARVFAEKTVAQAREAYDRSTGAFEAAVDTMQKSFDAAGQGAVALNRKILDIAQRNVSSGFDLAKSVAGARHEQAHDPIRSSVTATRGKSRGWPGVTPAAISTDPTAGAPGDPG